LVHPRQAAALGRSSVKWNNLHDYWVNTIKTIDESEKIF
jgi:hypothetical protein